MAQSSREIYWSAILADFRRSGLTHVEFCQLPTRPLRRSWTCCWLTRVSPRLRSVPHLKTDFEVAPVYLKEASRIQALLCVYFFALLTESLLERELRRAIDHGGDRQPAVVSRGSQMPSPHGTPGDRPVRGRATSLVASRQATAGRLHDRVEPAPTPNPAGSSWAWRTSTTLWARLPCRSEGGSMGMTSPVPEA